MTIVGTPTDWADLIDPMVPQILSLVIEAWEGMPRAAHDQGEDDITIALCQTLQRSRTARGLMFQIRTQLVELDPASPTTLGRMDIVFIPLIPREDIYFCLESKRLNVVKNGKIRAYAAEYVKFGIFRYVTGQYSRVVRHGGMIAYVLDGNITRAMINIKKNLQRHHSALGMTTPAFFPSCSLKGDARARETHHRRDHDPKVFRIHHLFMG